jgi:hypothetical protein
MSHPEESDDRSVLDSLGFGIPANLEPVDPPAEPLRPFSPSRDLTVSAPLTRRELRERERGDAAPSAAGKKKITARRGASPARPKLSRDERRVAKATLRRDAVRRTSNRKTIGARLLSFGAMLFAGALAFGMTVPANAFDWTQSGDPELAESMMTFDTQSVTADPTLVSVAERDTWEVTSWAEMLRARYGTRTFDYTVGTGPVRWPFPYAVPISSGFGDRAAPCRGCSTVHSGLDFNPGAGAPIYAVADGIVHEVSGGGSSWGTYVTLEHQIDGQTVYSSYAHMQSSSTPLVVGETIKVGDFVGLVGSTGQSTGAHLHLTISIGTPTAFIDPFTFLKRYAG